MTDIKAILDRIRQGMATAEDADILEVYITKLEEQRREAVAANRCYAARYGELAAVGEG